MDKYREFRRKFQDFLPPVRDKACRTDDKCRFSVFWLLAKQKRKNLNGFPEPHFVGKNEAAGVLNRFQHPGNTLSLIRK